jgi:DNA-binding LacI/PurR family transcriptional regulator
LLDSGTGRLVRVDASRGSVETVARLPGYTRGLAMIGQFAFVGLSKVRETSTFGGVPIAEGYLRTGHFNFHDGVAAGAAFLDLPQRPTAVFAGSDETAAGVIEAVRTRRLRIPEDMSVVGFDDIPDAAHFWPPLTTVRQDFAEIGRRCMALLLGGLEETEEYAGSIRPTLIVRASTGPPSTR